MVRTSWASASHQPWSKVRRPVGLGTWILLRSDSVPQGELRCLEAFPTDPVDGEGQHWTGLIVMSSVRSYWSHEPSQGHLGDKGKACPNQSLYHQCLDGHILLSDCGPSNASESVWKTGNTQILTFEEKPRNEELIHLLRKETLQDSFKQQECPSEKWLILNSAYKHWPPKISRYIKGHYSVTKRHLVRLNECPVGSFCIYILLFFLLT